MNYFKCINEVKPSYIIDTEPVFSETVLYENQTSTNENTITLSDDYSNYDIIKFYCYNPNEYYTQYTQYYITPTMLNHVVTYFDGYCCFNTPGTNQYTLYRVTSNTTLTYREARNMYPIKITGLKCSNGSIVETKIFEKQVIDTNWSPIETQYNLFDDFNILLGIAGCGWDELCITHQAYICANNKELNVINNNDTQLTEWNVPYYNHNAYTKVSEHSISDNYWIYVTGLKFIPNWDYYIEDIDSSYPSPINTQLKLASEENANKDWEISFKCSRIDQASALIDFGTASNSNGTLFGGALDTWGYSGNGFRWVGSRLAANFSIPTLNKEFYISKKNNILQIYVDNQLIKEVTFGSYTSYSENPLVLGRIDWKGADLYNIVYWDYFGFRWLS